MRKLFAAILLVTSAPCFGATIKFFTDYPNAVPVGSDYFVLQRGNSYINATDAQIKSDWFNNPVFTGNGGIQGIWTATTFVGDGSQLTGLNFTSTNITVDIITNNSFFTTNVTIEVGGGLTNFNATASTVPYWNSDNGLVSIANGSGALTNNGSGTVGWYPLLAILEGATNNDTVVSNALWTAVVNSTNGTTTTVISTNVVSTPTLWPGPSNTIVINNGYQKYATSTPTSITNQVTTSVWSTLVISNSLATSITQYCTVPNIRYIGPNSTNALTVGAGKVGIWSFLTFAGELTNCCNNAQQ